MYLLKFEIKIVQFEPLLSLCSFNSLQISVKAKWLNSKKNPWRTIENLVEKKASLHKKFWSIYVISVTWPNFTVVIKFRKRIMNRCSIKKLFLKIFQYSHEITCVGVSFLMKMQTFSPGTFLKIDSNKDFFLWILRNF